MKDVRIITISREFGSGGRSIGKKLAQELGVKYYDKELVKKIALESGFDPKYVEENGELAPAGNALAYARHTRRDAWHVRDRFPLVHSARGHFEDCGAGALRDRRPLGGLHPA